ncbi:phage holin family protein [Nitrincola sp. MINF-07-Sa-05]|uniref:phage holin family protein n=1 Tax=Nitrincola salilacus TaxID=3400273 RepID=UPI003917CC86
MFASLKTLAGTLLGMVHTRLEMLSCDLEEELYHIISLMVLALAVLFCAGVGVILVTLFLVVAFWDTHRLLVLGSLAGFFLVGALALWLFALHKVRTKERPFALSLSELQADRQQFEPRQ